MNYDGGMHVSELPERTQDYLKILWNHEEKTGSDAAMPLGDLAKAAGQKLPTTSEAVKRLAAKGLVEHERYFGVRLVEEGRELAVAMVRRHRLLETFVVRTLGYTGTRCTRKRRFWSMRPPIGLSRVSMRSSAPLCAIPMAIPFPRPMVRPSRSRALRLPTSHPTPPSPWNRSMTPMANSCATWINTGFGRAWS